MSCRFFNTLTLVRVHLDQTGSYTVTVSNEDDAAEVVFNLEIKGQRKDDCLSVCLPDCLPVCGCVCVCVVPPRITFLSEVGSTSVLCVSEGAPPPDVTWYTCNNSHR